MASATIHDLSWNTKEFCKKWQLFREARKKFRDKVRIAKFNQLVLQQLNAEANSSLSSTYYSINRTAGAQLLLYFKEWDFPGLLIWFFVWGWLGAWCWWRMLPHSNRVVELIGYDGMTATMCDNRQSILRARGRWEEALFCCTAGLSKKVTDSHTRGLLLVGRADVFFRQGKIEAAKCDVAIALHGVEFAEKSDPNQASRIYRDCARLVQELGMLAPDYHELMQKAMELAKQTGSRDQELKIAARV